MSRSRRSRLVLAFGLAAFVTGSCSRQPVAPAATGLLSTPPPRPQIMYVSVRGDATFHKVALVGLSSPAGSAFITDLTCLRVYFGGNRGICLTSTTEGAKTSWWADAFDERFTRGRRLPLTGEPSRVRVSPDGNLAAATVFEEGHSYAEHGFSTRTTLFDLANGTSLGDLEQFVTRRDSKPFHSQDFNFWGVSFAQDSDTFFATLDTGGVSYLVKGSVRTRTMDIVAPDVECPSLSPDNTRIAFKRRVGARVRGWWQLTVLRLDTLKETAVTAETRSVDDQVEWLDNDRVIYHLTNGTTASDLWATRVDNQAPPERLVSFAYSPAVVRASAP